MRRGKQHGDVERARLPLMSARCSSPCSSPCSAGNGLLEPTISVVASRRRTCPSSNTPSRGGALHDRRWAAMGLDPGFSDGCRRDEGVWDHGDAVSRRGEGLDGMAKAAVVANPVVAASPPLLHDPEPFGGLLGDSHEHREVAERKVRVSGETDQAMGGIRKKSPSAGDRDSAGTEAVSCPPSRKTFPAAEIGLRYGERRWVPSRLSVEAR